MAEWTDRGRRALVREWNARCAMGDGIGYCMMHPRDGGLCTVYQAIEAKPGGGPRCDWPRVEHGMGDEVVTDASYYRRGEFE